MEGMYFVLWLMTEPFKKWVLHSSSHLCNLLLKLCRGRAAATKTVHRKVLLKFLLLEYCHSHSNPLWYGAGNGIQVSAWCESILSLFILLLSLSVTGFMAPSLVLSCYQFDIYNTILLLVPWCSGISLIILFHVNILILSFCLFHVLFLWCLQYFLSSH